MENAQFRVEKVSPSFWEITFQNPPINLVDPQSITQLTPCSSWRNQISISQSWSS